tara:strand:- start:251 stop:757 length:507 start_codon:yes stop_codon:yes gene_type:complete
MYYTYAYLREDKRPYYIGKGKGDRAFRKREYAKCPTKDRILILKDDLTEEEAFKHEIYMIALYGRKKDGGILMNITLGGEGGSGYAWTEDQHKRHRQRMMGNKLCVGRKVSQETKDKIGKANSGRKWTAEQKSARSEAMRGKYKPDDQVSKKALYMREWTKRKQSQGS